MKFFLLFNLHLKFCKAFYMDPDPETRKKSDPDPDKKDNSFG